MDCARFSVGAVAARVARYQTPVKALVVVSKLGDGLFWYVLIAALALTGAPTVATSQRRWC